MTVPKSSYGKGDKIVGFHPQSSKNRTYTEVTHSNNASVCINKSIGENAANTI